MKRIFHWTISIVVAAFIGIMAISCIAGLGYALYLIATEAKIVLVFAAIIGVGYWIGSYIENHGWAWKPHNDQRSDDNA